MKDEKLQILKMVEEGKINSKEGIELLEALNDTKDDGIKGSKAKWIKIRVLEPDNNNRVNITLPVALLDVGMKIVTKVAPNFVPELKEAGLDDVDIRELLEAIKEGASGKLVDVESEKGEKVEIIVE